AAPGAAAGPPGRRAPGPPPAARAIRPRPPRPPRRPRQPGGRRRRAPARGRPRCRPRARPAWAQWAPAARRGSRRRRRDGDRSPPAGPPRPRCAGPRGWRRNPRPPASCRPRAARARAARAAARRWPRSCPRRCRCRSPAPRAWARGTSRPLQSPAPPPAGASRGAPAHASAPPVARAMAASPGRRLPCMFISTSLSGDKPQQYAALADQARALVAGERDRIANAANLAALVHHALPDLNWVGFYFYDGTELVVGPFQGLPACVRIPLDRGVCGAAARTGTTQRVEDVHAFPGHIACDAASRSELVVPLFRGGALLGVFDLDSPVPGRFDVEDQRGLEEIARVYVESLGT